LPEELRRLLVERFVRLRLADPFEALPDEL
jgi:hypothetical protein